MTTWLIRGPISLRSTLMTVPFQLIGFLVVMPGHSRSKNGVASLAYDPGIHLLAKSDGLPGQARQ
jgi:hypothetical protein